MNAPVQAGRSLYERLGQYEGISAIVDDIVEAHGRNPEIQARFLPVMADAARLSKAKEHLCRFLQMGSGGPAQYTGRSMPEAHKGMNISAAEYLAAMDDIVAVLRKRNVDEQTQKDVLAIAFSLKGEIIRR